VDGGSGNGVINVDVVVVGEVWIERDPSRPRSPEESTARLRNGVASREPFLITRTWPVWRQTKSRPSGENSIAVGGPERLPPNRVSVNSAGKVAASEAKAASVREAPHPRIDRQRKFERRKDGIAVVDRTPNQGSFNRISQSSMDTGVWRKVDRALLAILFR